MSRYHTRLPVYPYDLSPSDYHKIIKAFVFITLPNLSYKLNPTFPSYPSPKTFVLFEILCLT